MGISRNSPIHNVEVAVIVLVPQKFPQLTKIKVMEQLVSEIRQIMVRIYGKSYGQEVPLKLLEWSNFLCLIKNCTV